MRRGTARAEGARESGWLLESGRRGRLWLLVGYAPRAGKTRRLLEVGRQLGQVVEVVEHVVDALTILVGGVLQRLFHAGEPLVEHLAAEQILDLVVLLAALGAAPLVVGQFLDGLGR